MRRAHLISWLLFSFCYLPAALAGNEPHWLRINSGHFSILTDAGEKRGDEALLRFEQMRAVFGELLLKDKLLMSEPMDLIAFRSTEEYTAAAGQRPSSGCFLPGGDRNYVLLDLSDERSWQTVSRDFAAVMLRYNYPPTPAWFDVGFAEYFSSLRLDDGARLGADPGSFTSALRQRPWLAIAALFGTGKPNPAPIFRAQSWITVHYLITHNKLPETGAYFGLVELQRVPVEQAIQQAFGIPADQLAQAIRADFNSIPASPSASGAATSMQQFAALTLNDVGMSSQEVKLPEARALVAEAEVREPELRASAVKELEGIAADPVADNAVVHRALAWVHMEKGEYQAAMDELASASDRDKNNPWVRYYLALVKYREGAAGDQQFPGLANMMQDLGAVIDWNPEFAEAYDMLAMARLQGGGTYSALHAMQRAIQLSPRDESYRLHLAEIYLAGKKWDDASALLERLQSSSDAKVASAARQNLQDLPTLKKYGILPQHAGGGAQPAPVWSSPDDEEDASASAAASPAPGPDRRKTEYLQGRLLSVDCSHSPAAIVNISIHGRVRRFLTEDYKSLALIGADEFSCQWKNRLVVINYKAGGRTSGDLVSLEIQ